MRIGLSKAPGNVEEITHGKKSRRQRHSKYDVKSQVATLKAVTKRYIGRCDHWRLLKQSQESTEAAVSSRSGEVGQDPA